MRSFDQLHIKYNKNMKRSLLAKCFIISTEVITFTTLSAVLFCQSITNNKDVATKYEGKGPHTVSALFRYPPVLSLK